MNLWGCSTGASRRYQRRTAITMSGYILVVLGTSWEVKHHALHGLSLYLCAALPALPMIFTLVLMGRYLQEETDEYRRVQTTRSILVGTATLLGTIVLNDFIRSYTMGEGVPPFASFVIFCAAMGLAQTVQQLRGRGDDAESPA